MDRPLPNFTLHNPADDAPAPATDHPALRAHARAFLARRREERARRARRSRWLLLAALVVVVVLAVLL